MWDPPEVPFKLHVGKFQKKTRHRIDPMSQYFNLLFTAVDYMGTSVSWPEVDIISDRRALRILYNWINGKKDSFRIDLEPLGARALLLCEAKQEFFRRRDPGYGVVFEKKTTKAFPGTEKGIEHMRIVHYVSHTLSAQVDTVLTSVLPTELLRTEHGCAL